MNVLPYLSPLLLAAVTTAAQAQLDDGFNLTIPPIAAARSASGRERASDRDSATAPYSSDSEADQLPVGDQRLLQAIDQLELRRSIFVRLQHQVSLGGNQFKGVGSYWQQGRGDELQLRLELQIVDTEAHLIQASNGQFLWIDRQLPTGRLVTRVELKKLRTELQIGGRSGSQFGDDAYATIANDNEPSAPNSLLLSAAGGGLRGLLASLAENFTFLPPQAMTLSVVSPTAESKGDPSAAAEPKNVPVFAVVGHWREDRLAALLEAASQDSKEKSQRQAASALDGQSSALNTQPSTLKLPAHFPQEVLLLLGQADLFPYRVEYRRLETPPAADGESLPVYQLSPNPMVVMQLSDVTFDAPIAAAVFDYLPPKLQEWSDQTTIVLARLRSQTQQPLAGRGASEPSTPRR